MEEGAKIVVEKAGAVTLAMPLSEGGEPVEKEDVGGAVGMKTRLAGTLSSNKLVNRFIAAFLSRIGVHFFAMFLNARYKCGGSGAWQPPCLT